MIGKNMILSLVVACGLLLLGSAAYAQGSNGRCTALGASVAGAYHQIVGGINVANNCAAVGVFVEEFMGASCEPEDTGFINILENGASCNAIATICDAFFTCFNMEPDFCVDVPECTIP